MRSVCIASILVACVAVSQGQQPLPPAAPPDPVLDGHLMNWQKTVGAASNFSTKFELAKTESVFKKERKYAGSALCMKPNLARLSFGSTAKPVNPNKIEFEAYICNGKSLFEYNYAEKTITEIPLSQGQGDNLMLDFLGGMTPEVMKKRFQIAQFNPNDKNYVYFDIKPTLAKDSQEFEHMRFALYAPGVPAPFKAYYPAQMYIKKPGGDTEMWVFSEQVVNVPGIGAQHFQYEEPKDGKDWLKRKAPPPPAGPMAPPPGFVRPNK